MDLSKVPTADLEHINNGDMSKVSTATLEMLAGQPGGDLPESGGTDSEGNPIIDVTAGGDDMSVAEKLNNPNFGINTPEKLRAEIAKNTKPVIDEMGPVQKGIVGVGAGMYDAYKGAQQAGAELGNALGLVKPETVARITKEGQEARDMFAPLKEQSTAAKVGEFGGKLAPFLAIPAGGASGALARFATGAATGAGMGALEFVPEGGSRGMNTATGAAFGGAGALALSGLGKLYNAAAAGPLAKFAVNSLSERFKIPVTLSELTGKASRTDTLMERMPGFLGIKGFREGQQQAAKSAATEQFGKYVVDPTLDSTAAMKVANDAHLDDLYQVVRQNASSIPQAAAPEVKAAATELLDRYPAVFETIQDNHIKKILKNIVGDTADQVTTVPGAPPPLPNLTNTTAGKPSTIITQPKFSFDDLWSLRKGIGQAIGGAKTPTERAQLDRIYAAVSDDMDSMLAGQSDDALKAFKGANDAFKQYSLKFDAMRQAYDKAMGTPGLETWVSSPRRSTGPP